jgi:Nif-specific regulatory protein
MDGKVAAAEGGTLFLDDVSDLPLAAQGKLLQLLQSREYYPLGGATPVHADVRLIAATNVDLKRAVAERTFREDLFYRLDVLPVRMPTLAERRPDIEELAEFFCAEAVRHHGLPVLELSRSAIRALENAAWPGHIRQLEHVVQAAAIRAVGNNAKQVEREHLFPDVDGEPSDDEERLGLQEATRRFHRRLLCETLDSTEWNVAEAAQRLDVTRSHVYNLIRAFGLKRQRPTR